MKKGSRTFLSGVLVLTLANLITKVIGLIFKIPLTNMLGNEGMGYFNTAYQIYTWLYMLSTAGVPVALSMMVSECNARGRHSESKKLLRLTLTVFAIAGLIGSAAMLIFCRGLASFISADKAYLCILAISPALFFVCVSSTVRGYFQGRRNMVPTAVSEIIESSLKLIIGIALGYYALTKGYEPYTVAAYAILGVTVGVGAGAVFLSVSAFLSRCFSSEKAADVAEYEPQSSKRLLSTFFKIAIPVMLSSSLLSMSSMFDTLIVIGRLQDIGVSEEASVALYGNYTAYCVTLFNLPPVLIYPIVNTLIPSVSAAKASGNTAKVNLFVEKSLKLSALIALPCAAGLGVMSEPILKLIFSSEESASMAAPLLSVLAPSVFLIGIMAVTNAILQASKKLSYSVFSMLCGAAVKAALAYVLPLVKIRGQYLNMYAAPLSTMAFYLTITALNIFFIIKQTDIRIPVFRIFLRPLVAAAFCAVSAAGSYALLIFSFGYHKLFTLISIGVAAAFYLLMLILLGGITKEDIGFLPKGDRILDRFGFLNRILR